MSEIAEKVKAIIVEKLSVDAADVREEASFTNDLGADSLETVELMMDLEKEFGITIPEEESEKLSTVGDAIAYIEAHAEYSCLRSKRWPECHLSANVLMRYGTPSAAPCALAHFSVASHASPTNPHTLWNSKE